MIPVKLFSRLITSLVYFRTNPCDETNAMLEHDQVECNWPRNASAEQIAEWSGICERTRKEFDEKVRALRGDSQPDAAMKAEQDAKPSQNQ